MAGEFYRNFSITIMNNCVVSDEIYRGVYEEKHLLETFFRVFHSLRTTALKDTYRTPYVIFLK